MVWKVPVTWEMYAAISVEADSLEEAMEIARDREGKIPLPVDGYYVDGSWDLSCNEPESVLCFQSPEAQKYHEQQERNGVI